MPSRKKGLNHLPPTENIARAAAEMDAADRARALDKMHIDKMSRAMMGVLVSFAFDDEQGLRAAALVSAHGARMIGISKERLLELVGAAVDMVAKDAPHEYSEDNAKPSGLIVQ